MNLLCKLCTARILIKCTRKYYRLYDNTVLFPSTSYVQPAYEISNNQNCSVLYNTKHLFSSCKVLGQAQNEEQNVSISHIHLSLCTCTADCNLIWYELITGGWNRSHQPLLYHWLRKREEKEREGWGKKGRRKDGRRGARSKEKDEKDEREKKMLGKRVNK